MSYTEIFHEFDFLFNFYLPANLAYKKKEKWENNVIHRLSR